MKSASSLLLVVFFALTACGVPPVQVNRYTMDIYEPTANVEILHTWPLNSKYIEIADLEVNAGGDRANDALLDKAMEIGADAIVIEPVHLHSQVYVPIDAEMQNGVSPRFRKVALNSVRAIAIKFQT